MDPGPDPTPPKLRLAPAEPIDDIHRRLEREQRAQIRFVEDQLSQSLAPFRVGSVPYLNGVPLTRGLENQVHFAPPSRLAEMLRADELDAALVSVTEVLLNDRYDILDAIAIASLGEVQSVLLAHRQPLEALQEIHCDPASLTSVRLLQILLAERGIHPRLKPLPKDESEPLPDAALLIGDRALDFLLAPREHLVWDLGTAWFELTGLPFVYAVWALRRGIDHAPLRRQLREARNFGLETLETIVNTRTDYTLDFRRDYLGWHIHYHLGSDEKRGLQRFVELLEKHGHGPVYPPHYVV